MTVDDLVFISGPQSHTINQSQSNRYLIMHVVCFMILNVHVCLCLYVTLDLLVDDLETANW